MLFWTLLDAGRGKLQGFNHSLSHLSRWPIWKWYLGISVMERLQTVMLIALVWRLTFDSSLVFWFSVAHLHAFANMQTKQRFFFYMYWAMSVYCECVFSHNLMSVSFLSMSSSRSWFVNCSTNENLLFVKWTSNSRNNKKLKENQWTISVICQDYIINKIKCLM